MKYFIVLEAVQNRRVDSLFVDLSHKLCGKEMMLLPRLDTMSDSSRSLASHVGICNELLKFFCLMLDSISSDMFSCPPHGHI